MSCLRTKRESNNKPKALALFSIKLAHKGLNCSYPDSQLKSISELIAFCYLKKDVTGVSQ